MQGLSNSKGLIGRERALSLAVFTYSKMCFYSRRPGSSHAAAGTALSKHSLILVVYFRYHTILSGDLRGPFGSSCKYLNDTYISVRSGYQ